VLLIKRGGQVGGRCTAGRVTVIPTMTATIALLLALNVVLLFNGAALVEKGRCSPFFVFFDIC
jgi:hypothetical protein